MAKGKRFSLEDLKKSKVVSLNMETIENMSLSEACSLLNKTGTLYYRSTSSNHYDLYISPRGKPRMVRSDSWKKRKIVTDYWAWKDELIKEATRCGLNTLPGKFKVIFHIPMPSSWSKKKKASSEHTPHRSKPDIDNLLKALQDCLCEDDSHIYDVHAVKKWAHNGFIKIETPNI